MSDIIGALTQHVSPMRSAAPSPDECQGCGARFDS
jgi:hypothetical protein